MRGRRSIAFCCVLFMLMALMGAVQSAWSQEVTAAIVGTVTDPSGAPIKGAGNQNNWDPRENKNVVRFGLIKMRQSSPSLAAQATSTVVDKTKEGTKTAIDKTKQGAETVKDTSTSTAKKVGSKTKKGADTVIDKTKSGTKKAVNAVKKVIP